MFVIAKFKIALVRKPGRKFYYFKAKFQGSGFSFPSLNQKIKVVIHYLKNKFGPLGFKTLPLLGHFQNLLLPLYFWGIYVCNRGDTVLHHGGLHTDFKSVQSREFGQSPIGCTGWPRHHAPRAHNVRSIPYPYMKVIPTYNYVAGLQSLQWLLLCPRASQQVSHFWVLKETD